MGYVTISNELIDELSPHETLVYLAIKRHYPKAHPSIPRIAEVSGLSKAAVERALKTLRERGLVLVRRTGRSNWYVVRDEFPTPLTEASDTSVRGIRSLTQRPKEEQVRTQIEEDKTLLAARAQEDQMHLGKLPDDPPSEVEQDTAAKAGRKRVLTAWANAAGDVGVRRWNRGLLNKHLSELRKQGYSDDEIEILMAHFFARDPQNLRTKAREHDLAILFGQELNSGLEARCKDQIQLHRSGSDYIERSRSVTRAIAEEWRTKYAATE